jgi:hypothetical protein
MNAQFRFDTVAATGKAMADAISKMPPPVTNVAPAEVRNEITVQPASAPEVRNEITVQPANAPEVRLEATVEAPTVNVAAPQVTVRSYPASSTEEIERDERGEMVRVHRKNED